MSSTKRDTAFKIKTKSVAKMNTPLTIDRDEFYKELDINNPMTTVISKYDTESGNQNNQENVKISEQYEIFTNSMKTLFFWGQLIGVIPISGTSKNDLKKLHINKKSWRFIYSMFIFSTEVIITILCVLRLRKLKFGVNNFAFAYFYAACNLTTLMFFLMSKMWPALCKQIANSSLDEYVDHRVKSRCTYVTWTLISLSILEHVFSVILKSAFALNCRPDEDFYKAFGEFSFPWFFEMGVEYNIFLGFILQILNFIYTMNWNFSDIFIICISLYLTSVLNKINEKIVSVKDKNLPPTFWRALRLDYTRATKLVRSIDGVISSIVFTTFAINLFFICLQLFLIFSHGFQLKVAELEEVCPNFNNGLFRGYENAIYLCYSLIFLLGKSSAVLLVAAEVHSATLVPATALFDVPHTAYCEEVQRFIEQVTNDVVALSGLHFFSVTRKIVLPVAGTIVTYELVLLQFNV